MRYSDVIRLIQEEIRKKEEKLFTHEECPVCKKFATMIKVEVDDEENNEYTTKYRCLNCLSLLEKELKLQKETKTVIE